MPARHRASFPQRAIAAEQMSGIHRVAVHDQTFARVGRRDVAGWGGFQELEQWLRANVGNGTTKRCAFDAHTKFRWYWLRQQPAKDNREAGLTLQERMDRDRALQYVEVWFKDAECAAKLQAVMQKMRELENPLADFTIVDLHVQADAIKHGSSRLLQMSYDNGVHQQYGSLGHISLHGGARRWLQRQVGKVEQWNGFNAVEFTHSDVGCLWQVSRGTTCTLSVTFRNPKHAALFKLAWSAM